MTAVCYLVRVFSASSPNFTYVAHLAQQLHHFTVLLMPGAGRYRPKVLSQLSAGPSTPVEGSYSAPPTVSMAPGLESLQSKEHRNLLDEIDSLRLQGVADLIPLLQIVVCGDQSSGKSSVLEAVSGVPFPRSDVLCTRFATEVILRPADALSIAVSIIPALHTDDGQRAKLEAVKETIQGLDEFPELVEKAKVHMGLENGSAFSRHVLRVEVAGPGKPKLTIVDLPGLIHSANKEQSENDKDLITELVESYVSNARSIVLAVVSAKNDIANQIILSTTRKHDPDGQRTLGLITKPDLLKGGSQSEAQFIELANNANINLRLGWHVVKNRDYEDRDSSAEQRDKAEQAFFEKGKWSQLPRDIVGVKTLRERLSRVLLIQVKKHLPTLVDDVRQKLAQCQAEMEKLGTSRSTVDEQRGYLLTASQSFQTICRAALDGAYDGSFFRKVNGATQVGPSKRLRSIVQNLNQAFANDMRNTGHYRVLIDGEKTLFSGSKPEEAADPGHAKNGVMGSYDDDMKQIYMTTKEHHAWMKELMQESRGRELPGSFNPLLITELYHDQSQLWPAKAQDHVANVIKVAWEFVICLAYHSMDEQTASNLKNYWLESKLEVIATTARDALERLCIDRCRHPITYNHYCTDNLQKLRKTRQAKDLRKTICAHINLNEESAGESFNRNINVDALVEKIQGVTIVDPDEFACLELMDNMSAFYKVSQQDSHTEHIC